MKGILIQVAATIILSMGNLLAGFAIAWASDALEVLESDHSPLGTRITKTEGSLIGSLPMLGLLTGSLIAGRIADVIGRKKTVLIGGLCFILSGAIVTTASTVTMILVGRFLIGIGSGAHLVACSVFVCEFSQISIRGTLISLLTFAYVAGPLVAYVMGWMCSYDVINYFSLTLSVVFVVLTSFLKDPPAVLIAMGKEEEALESMQFYRGVSKATQDVLDELQYIRNQRESSNEGKHSHFNDIEKSLHSEKEKLTEMQTDEISELTAWQTLCSSKADQRALIIVTVQIILMVFGGTIAVQVYAGKLFEMAVPSLSGHMCSVIMALSFAVGAGLAMTLSDLIGRRTLMLTSGFLSSLCLAVLASLLRWSWAPEWTIAAVVLGYGCSFQMGVANVPFIQVSECFTPKLKSLASTVAISLMCLSNFVVLILFTPTVELLGIDGTFLMFSGICALMTVIAFLFMKETKGVPIEEIQAMFAQGFLYKKSKK